MSDDRPDLIYLDRVTVTVPDPEFPGLYDPQYRYGQVIEIGKRRVTVICYADGEVLKVDRRWVRPDPRPPRVQAFYEWWASRTRVRDRKHNAKKRERDHDERIRELRAAMPRKSRAERRADRKQASADRKTAGHEQYVERKREAEEIRAQIKARKAAEKAAKTERKQTGRPGSLVSVRVGTMSDPTCPNCGSEISGSPGEFGMGASLSGAVGQPVRWTSCPHCGEKLPDATDPDIADAAE